MDEIDAALSIRSVELAVGDLPRSVEFYERALGLPLLSRDEQLAQLGTDARAPALVLRQLAAPTPLPVCATGLFHVAWLHPSRGALADSVRRVARSGWPLEGASDHGVSEAIYLSDPDGLGIELYADRPRASWPRPPGGEGVAMVTLALDVEDLLAQSAGGDGDRVPAGTGVGHVHLKVADVPRASAFYRDALGFGEQARMPSAAFLGAGGYHHHIGLNSWQSAGAAAAPDSAPGLRRIEFELSSQDALERLAQELRAAGGELLQDNGELSLADPDDTVLAFVHA